jgi:chromosome segregation ATPase
VTTEKEDLQSQVERLSSDATELRSQLQSALDETHAAVAREKQAQDDLDASKAAHSRQLLQRQRREAELEQTIAQLGSALSMAKQQQQQQQQQSADPDMNGLNQLIHREQDNQPAEVVNYKERWEQVTEEVETLRVQLTMEVQRRQALEQELQEMAQERTEEAALEQSRQAQNDRKISELEATISRLQSLLRGYQSLEIKSEQSSEASQVSQQQLSKQLEDAHREIPKLSDQLLRHHGLAKNAKTEILALKGRLQAAITRAEEAEKAEYHNPSTPIYSMSTQKHTPY